MRVFNRIGTHTGGDGTFLKAALNNNGKTPQLGINTDPNRSRGQLCAHTCYQACIPYTRIHTHTHTHTHTQTHTHIHTRTHTHLLPGMHRV